MNRFLLIFLLFGLFSRLIIAQVYTVSGYVTDKETGETLIGTTVAIKGTTQGTSTDINGYFRLTNLKSGEYILQFSFLGYVKIERKLIVLNKSVLLNETALQKDAISLNDISVIGIKSDTIGDK